MNVDDGRIMRSWRRLFIKYVALKYVKWEFHQIILPAQNSNSKQSKCIVGKVCEKVDCSRVANNFQRQQHA